MPAGARGDARTAAVTRCLVECVRRDARMRARWLGTADKWKAFEQLFTTYIRESAVHPPDANRALVHGLSALVGREHVRRFLNEGREITRAAVRKRLAQAGPAPMVRVRIPGRWVSLVDAAGRGSMPIHGLRARLDGHDDVGVYNGATKTFVRAVGGKSVLVERDEERNRIAQDALTVLYSHHFSHPPTEGEYELIFHMMMLKLASACDAGAARRFDLDSLQQSTRLIFLNTTRTSLGDLRRVALPCEVRVRAGAVVEPRW